MESEEKKILKEIAGEPASPTSTVEAGMVDSAGADTTANDSIDNAEVDIEVIDSDEGLEDDPAVGGATESPAGSTRSKLRQRKKAIPTSS